MFKKFRGNLNNVIIRHELWYATIKFKTNNVWTPVYFFILYNITIFNMYTEPDLEKIRQKLTTMILSALQTTSDLIIVIETLSAHLPCNIYPVNFCCKVYKHVM